MADKKVANSVVALSSAAVLAIYGVGYARTRAAADRFAQQAAERRPHIPAPRGDDAAALDLTTSLPATSVNPIEEASTREPEPVVAEAAPGRTEATRVPREEAPSPVAKKESPAAPAATKSTAAVTTPSDDESPANAEGAPAAAGGPRTADTSDAAVAASGASPADAVTAAPATPPEPVKTGYKDGTFYGWGTSRHGDIQAAVVVESGRITVARVERCLTRYSCNWITPIPPRILSKQGTTYDYVSGATESSDAFQDAVAEALSRAK